MRNETQVKTTEWNSFHFSFLWPLQSHRCQGNDPSALSTWHYWPAFSRLHCFSPNVSMTPSVCWTAFVTAAPSDNTCQRVQTMNGATTAVYFRGPDPLNCLVNTDKKGTFLLMLKTEAVIYTWSTHTPYHQNNLNLLSLFKLIYKCLKAQTSTMQ